MSSRTDPGPDISQPPAPARRFRLVALLAILTALVAGWSVLWFQAANRAEERIAGWLARETKSERFYGCARQDIGGFPFRFELRCTDPQAEFRALHPALSMRASDLTVALQIYQPNLLIAEIAAPLTAERAGTREQFTANWENAQASLSGTPQAPERFSLVFVEPVLTRKTGDISVDAFTAAHAELHGRLAGGQVKDSPIIDIALSLVGAIVPELHPLAAQAFDIDLDIRLTGLRNFDPKPWAERFREIQKANGRIEIRSIRLQQDETLAIADGALSLTEAGYLQGELQMTIAGLDKLLPTLEADQLVRPGSSASKRLDAALESLDRAIPGLGQFARQKAGLGIAAGAAFLGKPAELEGQKAMLLPLQFSDGEMRLGPLRLGRIAPLF